MPTITVRVRIDKDVWGWFVEWCFARSLDTSAILEIMLDDFRRTAGKTQVELTREALRAELQAYFGARALTPEDPLYE